MLLLNCIFIVAILVTKESANGAPPPDLATELKAITDKLYKLDLLFPDVTTLNRDINGALIPLYRDGFKAFAKVLQDILAKEVKLSFVQLIDIKIFHDLLHKLGKSKFKSETLAKMIDSISLVAGDILQGLDKMFTGPQHNKKDMRNLSNILLNYFLSMKKPIEAEYEEHLNAARKTIAEGVPNNEAIENFFHYYYYADSKSIHVKLGSMFEAIEIFSYVSKKHLRENLESSDALLIDLHVRKVYVILKVMGLNMHFTSEELYRHVSLDVSSVESLKKKSDLYYVDNQARQIYAQLLGSFRTYGEDATQLLAESALLAMGKIAEIRTHLVPDKQGIVKHLVVLAMVVIELQHQYTVTGHFGQKLAASPEIARGLQLIKDVVHHADFHLHSKIALKAVEIKFLMEARSGKPEQIKTDIDELIQLLHLLPVNHGLGAITQIALHRLGRLLPDLTREFPFVADNEFIADAASLMGDFYSSDSKWTMRTYIRDIAPLKKIDKTIVAETRVRENRLLRFYIALSSAEVKGQPGLTADTKVCDGILEVHKFAGDNLELLPVDTINLRKSSETEENIKTIEDARKPKK